MTKGILLGDKTNQRSSVRNGWSGEDKFASGGFIEFLD
jgi:hypothetical protein